MSTDESYESTLEEQYNEKDFQSELFGLCEAINEEDLEWALPKHRESCWVNVDNLSVRIKRTDEGIVVVIFEDDKEELVEYSSVYKSFPQKEED